MRLKTLYDTGICTIGDSITLGQSATAGNAYVSRLQSYVGGTLYNLAVSGTGMCVASGKAVGLTKKRKLPLTIMAGLNDVRRLGLSAIPKIETCLRASIAASLVGDSVPASSLAKTGTWTALSSSAGGRAVTIGGSAQYTADINATMTWEFRGTSLVVGAIANPLTSSTYRDIEIIVDGTSYDLAVEGVADIEPYGYPAFVLQGLADGLHTVVIKPKSANTWTVVDYVGVLADPGATGPIFVGHMPYITNWVYAGFTSTPEMFDAANAAIDAVVAEFAGYPVTSVPTNDFYDTATGCSADGIHPNNTGHYQIYEAFRSKMSMWN